MGCFNVACSVSNVSISHHTKTAFIPLLPKHFPWKKVHELENKTSLTYANHYYNPFCLPIFGEYNDYGSLENIIENDNTKAVEDFFGISIQEFIDIVRSGRDIKSNYGDLFETFGIYKTFFKSHENSISEDNLLLIGFEKTDTEKLKFPGKDILISLDGKKINFFNSNNDLLSTTSGHNTRRDLNEYFYKYTGYYLNVSKDNQERVTILSNLSGMYVHADIFDELVMFDFQETTLKNGKLPFETLLDYGFQLVNKTKVADKVITEFKKESYPVKITHDGRFYEIVHLETGKKAPYVMEIGEFFDIWERYTGEVNDISRFSLVSKFEPMFDSFSAWLRGDSDEGDYFAEDILKDLEVITDQNEIDSLKRMLAHNRKMRFHNFKEHEFGHFFEGWKYFGTMYADLIKEGKLKEELIRFINFSSSMFSCNRFYFPTTSGEQHGNHSASKMLLEKSLEIVNNKLKEYDEDEE